MQEFKILTKAVDLFKQINNGEDEAKLRLHNVELFNERSLDMDDYDFPYTMFEFEDRYDNRTALEHARNCAYEQIIREQDGK